MNQSETVSATNKSLTSKSLSPEEQAMMVGDLSRLTEGQRASFMRQVCDSLGLNPYTRPFEYILLKNKLTFYARKDATEQLRKRDNISLTIVKRDTIDGVHFVTAQAKMPTGRLDEATGAVGVAGLRGDDLANAIMKAETKAKRRVTLSICGLGFLDESELETIPASHKSYPVPDSLTSEYPPINYPEITAAEQDLLEAISERQDDELLEELVIDASVDDPRMLGKKQALRNWILSACEKLHISEETRRTMQREYGILTLRSESIGAVPVDKLEAFKDALQAMASGRDH